MWLFLFPLSVLYWMFWAIVILGGLWLICIMIQDIGKLTSKPTPETCEDDEETVEL